MSGGWHDCGAPDGIAAGAARCVTVDGVPVLIVHTADAWYAVEAQCSHEGFPLCHGAVQGARIKCPLHGSRFDLATGAALDDPADAPLMTHDVDIRDGRIMVRLGCRPERSN